MLLICHWGMLKSFLICDTAHRYGWVCTSSREMARGGHSLRVIDLDAVIAYRVALVFFIMPLLLHGCPKPPIYIYSMTHHPVSSRKKGTQWYIVLVDECICNSSTCQLNSRCEYYHYCCENIHRCYQNIAACSLIDTPDNYALFCTSCVISVLNRVEV